MRRYEKPEIEVIVLKGTDVLTVSGDTVIDEGDGTLVPFSGDFL